MSIRARMRSFSLEQRRVAQGEAGALEWVWSPIRTVHAAVFHKSGRTAGEYGMAYLDEYVVIAEPGIYRRSMRLCDGETRYQIESVEQQGRYALLLCSREEDAV